jgi:hypothetical protein
VAKLRPLFGMLEREYGFELDRRHFAIVGRCRSCRPGMSNGDRPPRPPSR